MWGFPEAVLKNPLVLERGLNMIEEMIKRDYHHPCIVICGLHNEIATHTEAGYDIKKLLQTKSGIWTAPGSLPMLHIIQ